MLDIWIGVLFKQVRAHPHVIAQNRVEIVIEYGSDHHEIHVGIFGDDGINNEPVEWVKDVVVDEQVLAEQLIEQRLNFRRVQKIEEISLAQVCQFKLFRRVLKPEH